MILSPEEVWSEMPPKGDITDWVNSCSQVSTDELVKQLETAIALAFSREEQERLKTEEAKISADLPEWSQSDIALWLANKYKGRLAWNTDLQEWYRYSSVTAGIWTVEPVEFIVSWSIKR